MIDDDVRCNLNDEDASLLFGVLERDLRETFLKPKGSK